LKHLVYISEVQLCGRYNKSTGFEVPHDTQQITSEIDHSMS